MFSMLLLNAVGSESTEPFEQMCASSREEDSLVVKRGAPNWIFRLDCGRPPPVMPPRWSVSSNTTRIR
jgi:hypothetical protein